MGGSTGNPYAGKPLPNQVSGAYGQALGSTADIAQGGALGRTDLTPYTNPWQQAVIDPTMAELNRQETIQGNTIADQATKQGAFGGDRFAIQQAENNRNYDTTRATALANLNSQGYTQAQDAAKFDIANQGSAAQGLGNLANLGFGWGQQLQQNQLASGALQQQQQQQLMDAIKSQFQGYTGQGQNALATYLKSLGISGGVGTQSTQTAGSPGILGTLGSILGIIGQL